MKYLMALMLLISAPCFAKVEVSCYAHHKRAYHRHPIAAYDMNGYFIFRYKNYDDIIFTDNCVIRNY